MTNVAGHAAADYTAHYANHLAPIYLWMVGGFEAAVARGDLEIAEVLPDLAPGQRVVDLGAGFGMHTIPLARRGCAVLAIDSSPLLLDELRRRAGTLPIRTIEDDLLAFADHLEDRPDLILCMGDTLTHLPDFASLERLFAEAARVLEPGGRFISSFRDYTGELLGEQRFIPVRSDEDRILTCFLEYATDSVVVHDILHERQGSLWSLRVSRYPKLRVSPDRVVEALAASGFSARVEPGQSGMVRVIGTRR